MSAQVEDLGKILRANECVYSFAYIYYCYVVHTVMFISVIKDSFAMKYALMLNCAIWVQSCHDLGKIL